MFKLRKSLTLFIRIKNIRSAIVDGANDKFEKLEKRVVGTFAEKWLKFWINLSRDYRDVALDVIKEARNKPTKAIIIGTTGWLTTAFYLHNPNATHFRDTFLQASNEAAVVHHTLVRPDVLDHLKYIESCYNNNTLRYRSLGLFSIIWIDKNSSQCTAYETQCDYLKYGYRDKLSNIVDIGFLDSWWFLIKKMKDYDVNI